MTSTEPAYTLALESIVTLALCEDLGDEGDITSKATIPAGAGGVAVLIVRQPCTVSGLDAARETCRQVDPRLVWLPLVEDGQAVPAGAEVARLEGEMLSILAAERTAINFLSHLSGVATLTQGFVAALDGLPTRVAATRKTNPGMRLLEKKAVADGGGETHRLGLYDAILIKDNHIAASGGVAAAIESARRNPGNDLPVEVEVDTQEQLAEVIEAGADRVLLDNMDPVQVRACVQLAAGSLAIEASGGINLDNARAYAEAGADIISAGALTMSAPAIDFSLEVRA